MCLAMTRSARIRGALSKGAETPKMPSCLLPDPPLPPVSSDGALPYERT